MRNADFVETGFTGQNDLIFYCFQQPTMVNLTTINLDSMVM
jgi:hypothetical protein